MNNGKILNDFYVNYVNLSMIYVGNYVGPEFATAFLLYHLKVKEIVSELIYVNYVI